MAVSAQEQLDAQAPVHTTSFLRAPMISVGAPPQGLTSTSSVTSDSRALYASRSILVDYMLAVSRDLRALENSRHNSS